MNLMESYKGRLSIAESYYAQKNNGAKLSNAKKMLTAQCLSNVANFMNEAFNTSTSATQRSDMGMFKKMCMDITTITIPNLIVNDIFMVKPMSTFSGYVTYMSYALGEDKNGMGGFVVNDPFTLGAMSEARAEYTGEKIVEAAEAGEFIPAWTPVVGNKVIAITAAGVETEVELADGKCTLPADTAKVKYSYDNQTIPQDKLPTLVGHMEGIALTARARRIAIKYSQFAAFQS